MEDNSGMDMAPIRRRQLRYLIDTEYGGSQTAFIEKTGINQGELSGLLNKKSFGEKKARSIELAADLPCMYLDRTEVSKDQRSESGGATSVLHVTGKTETTILTREQKQILSFMESMDSEDRKAWLKVGASLSKLNQSAETDLPKPQSAHGVNEESISVESEKKSNARTSPKRLGTNEGRQRENTRSPDSREEQPIERRTQQIPVAHDLRKRPWDYKGGK